MKLDPEKIMILMTHTHDDSILGPGIDQQAPGQVLPTQDEGMVAGRLKGVGKARQHRIPLVVDRRGFSMHQLGSLDDRSPEVQLALLNLFEQHPSLLSGEVLAPWINARLASSDAALAGGAARNLAATNDPETMPRLTSILHGNQPGEARLGALKGLAGMAGGEATADDLIRALLPVFGDDDRQIRLEAMAVLAKLAADAGDWPNPAGDLLLALMQGSLIAPPQEMPEVAPQAEIQDEGEDSQDSQDADSEPEAPVHLAIHRWRKAAGGGRWANAAPFRSGPGLFRSVPGGPL